MAHDPDPTTLPFPVMGAQVPANRYVALDLSPGSALLAGWAPGDMPDLERRIRARVSEAGAAFGWGGYLEDRRLYASSKHFAAGREARNLHLGIDLWAAAGTPLYAPFEGSIHSLAMNGAHLDYGATIILHHPGVGTADYSLYGHLSEADLTRWRPGDRVRAGECLAHIGRPDENGGWAPHLHLQLIRDLGGRQGDFPGVALVTERDYWVGACPDPQYLIFTSELQ